MMVAEKIHKKLNKRTVVFATVLGIFTISMGYFAYNFYSDYKIKSVALSYLKSSELNTSKDDFEIKIKQITTADFLKRNLSKIESSFINKDKSNVSVDKILLVDRRKAAVEAEVFYTARPSNETYYTPEQLNLVLYKEPTGWKVQDAYFMSRSDQPIPSNSEIEQSNQVERYSCFLDNINRLLQARMNGDIVEYNSIFSEEIDSSKYVKLFTDEQDYLRKNNLKLSLTSNGLLVNSSTDLEALTTLLLNQSTGQENKSIPPLKLKFVYEKGEWKISDIYS